MRSRLQYRLRTLLVLMSVVTVFFAFVPVSTMEVVVVDLVAHTPFVVPLALAILVAPFIPFRTRVAMSTLFVMLAVLTSPINAPQIGTPFQRLLNGGDTELKRLGFLATNTPAEVEVAVKARAVEYAAKHPNGERQIESWYIDPERPGNVLLFQQTGDGGGFYGQNLPLYYPPSARPDLIFVTPPARSAVSSKR